MGVFSWKTCDTLEPIPAVMSPHDPRARTVYLLQPGGEAPLEEPAYQGYGVFAGVDAFVWLARRNLPRHELAGLDDRQLRNRGISLDQRDVFADTTTGEKFSLLVPCPHAPAVRMLSATMLTHLDEFGTTPEQLLSSRRWHPARAVDLAWPLKFSFNPHARYEDLPESEPDPDQGTD